jgi:hypothetical protein
MTSCDPACLHCSVLPASFCWPPRTIANEREGCVPDGWITYLITVPFELAPPAKEVTSGRSTPATASARAAAGTTVVPGLPFAFSEVDGFGLCLALAGLRATTPLAYLPSNIEAFYPESLSAHGDAAMCPANGDVLVRVNNSSMFPVVVGDSTVPSLASSRKAYMLDVLALETSPRSYCVARKLPGGDGGFVVSRLGAAVPSALFGALFSPQRPVPAVGPASRLSPSANAARTPQGADRIGGQQTLPRLASVSVFGSTSSPGSRSTGRSPAPRAVGALSPAALVSPALLSVPAPTHAGTGGIAYHNKRRLVAPAAPAAASATVTADGWQHGLPAHPAAPPPARARRSGSSRGGESLAASVLMLPTTTAPRKRPSLFSSMQTDSDASGSDASGGSEAAFATAPSARAPSFRKKTPSWKARQAEGAVEDADDAAAQPSMSDDDEFLPTRQ